MNNVFFVKFNKKNNKNKIKKCLKNFSHPVAKTSD